VASALSLMPPSVVPPLPISDFGVPFFLSSFSNSDVFPLVQQEGPLFSIDSASRGPLILAFRVLSEVPFGLLSEKFLQSVFLLFYPFFSFFPSSVLVKEFSQLFLLESILTFLNTPRFTSPSCVLLLFPF